MSHASASFIRRVGLLDALALFALWSVVLVLLSQSSEAAYFGLVSLAPLAVLVGWRGTGHAHRVASERASAYQAVSEGAMFGAFVAAVMFVLSWAIPRALAAGHALDGFSPLRLGDWVVLFAVLGPLVAVGAGVGALHGLALHLFNTWLFKWRSAQ